MREWQLGPGAEDHLIKLESRLYSCADVTETLKNYVSKERQQKIDELLSNRSLKYVLVLDQIHNQGNVSAILRTAEAMGVQCVHRIKDPDGFKLSPRSSRGAESWMSLQHWEEPQACLTRLKESGYRIAVSDLNARDEICDLDLSRPTAFVLGHEIKGVSEVARDLADTSFKLSQVGLTQSLNVSVASAVLLSELFQHRRREGIGDLSEREQESLRALLFSRQVSRSNAIINRFVRAQ